MKENKRRDGASFDQLKFRIGLLTENQSIPIMGRGKLGMENQKLQ